MQGERVREPIRVLPLSDAARQLGGISLREVSVDIKQMMVTLDGVQ